MAVFKSIDAESYVVEPFEVNASHSFVWTSGSVDLSGSGFSINLVNEPPINYPIGSGDLGGTTDGGFYSYPMFNSIKKYFYSLSDGSTFFGNYNDLDLNATNAAGHYSFNTVGGNDTTAGTLTNDGFKVALSLLIHKTSGTTLPMTDLSTQYDNVAVNDIVTYRISDRRWYKYIITSVDESNPSPLNTAGVAMPNRFRFGIEFIESDTYDGIGDLSYSPGSHGAQFVFAKPGGNIYEFYPSGSMFVWNIGSNYIGEGIKQNTFKIELDGSSLNIRDDGSGKLRLNQTSSVVGNVFYKQGIATVQRNMTASANLISADGIYISASAGVTSSFQSVMDIYEHTVSCRLEPEDFNVTFNPTTYALIDTGSGDYRTGYTSTYNQALSSGSATGPSGSSTTVLPYITTIGLYNGFNEMMAVAKLSKPITRMKYTNQTFVIKFDE